MREDSNLDVHPVHGALMEIATVPIVTTRGHSFLDEEEDEQLPPGAVNDYDETEDGKLDLVCVSVVSLRFWQMFLRKIV